MSASVLLIVPEPSAFGLDYMRPRLMVTKDWITRNNKVVTSLILILILVGVVGVVIVVNGLSRL